MQRVNVNEFYVMGHNLHALSTMRTGNKLADYSFTLYSARMWLEFVLQDHVIPLTVSKPAGSQLHNAIVQILEPRQADGSAGTPDMQGELGPFEVYNITSSLQTFEIVLAAELQHASTYFVSRKQAYETSILIEEAERLLPDSIRAQVPDQVNWELKQAGKCIAFEIPTAAGFHIIRATEIVIRKYYEVFVGTSPAPKTRNWGAYARALRGTEADPKTVGFIDHIRENYRNPVLHPEQTLTSEDAQVLLGVCISAIVLMVSGIEDAASALPAPVALPEAADSEPTD